MLPFHFACSPQVHQWDVKEVGRWLDSIEMSKYHSIFEENQINGRLLPVLAFNNGHLLKSMGIPEEDRQILIQHILRVVFGYSGKIFFDFVLER